MKQIPLSEVKDDLSHFAARSGQTGPLSLRGTASRQAVLIGFETEDDWFEYRLENDERFLRRVEGARKNIRAGPRARGWKM